MQYGLSSGDWNTYDERISDDELVLDHVFTMQIEWHEDYYFRVASTDYSGNGPAASTTDENPSLEQTLTSTGDPPPDSDASSNSGDDDIEDPDEPTCFIDYLLN